MTGDQELVDLLEREWSSMASLADLLGEDEWKLPTDLPGWSVQDNLVHVYSIEASLLGRAFGEGPEPEAYPEHVKNTIAQRNERLIDARRSWSGPEVLAEFLEVTTERLAQLRSFDADAFGAPSWTPVGPGTVRDLLPFRLFDAWVHEQDMRWAVERPGHLDGPVPEFVRGMAVDIMPYVVGKKVGAPDGTTVVFDCVGPLAGTVAVGVDGGRGRRLDEVPPSPTVRLVIDGETFLRLACGRVLPDEALEESLVRIHGDEALGRRVLDEMNYLF